MPVYETQIVVSNYLDVSSTEPVNPVHGQKWMDGTIMKTWDDTLKEWVLEDLKGESSSLWIRYADDDKGNGFSSSITGKKYVAMKPVINNPIPSDDPADYEGLWGEFKGESIEGPPGQDGSIKWTWMRYADNVSGGGISAESEGKMYIGFAYNKDTATPSNNPKDYAWSAMYDEAKMLELQEQINNIQIGGTNLIRDSAFDEGFTHFPIANKGFSVDSSKKFMNQNTLKFQWEAGVGTFPSVVDDFIEVREAGLVGQEMTLSVYVFIPEDAVLSSMPYAEVCGYETTSQIANNLAGTNSRIDISKNTEKGKWQRLSVTFTVQERNGSGTINYVKVLLRHRAHATPTVLDKFWYALPQLEKGNKLSDWSMSQMDVATNNDLNSLNYVATNLWAEDYYDKNIGHLNADGSINPNVYYRYTDKISVNGATSLLRTVFEPATTATGMRFTYFNSNDEVLWIGPQHTTSKIGSTYEKIPEGAVSFQTYAARKDTGIKMKIELGNKPTDWSVSPLDTATTNDISNVQTELQNRLDTIVMPVTQPNAPANPKEGMVWWQDDLKGDIIGMFKYMSNYWVPQTIQQSMLSIIELYAVRIIGATITGTEISGSTIISAFDVTITHESPERRRGTLTLDKGYALIKYEQYNENTPNVVINKGETRMDEYGISTTLKDKNDNILVTSQYGPLGININDRSKPYGTVNLGYSDLLSINDTALTASADWAVYATSGDSAPFASRSQGTITLSGAFKPLKELAVTGVSESYVMAVLPPGLRPSKRMEFTNAGSGLRKYLLSIYPNGNVVAARNTSTNGYTPFNAGGFYSISCNFTAETV